MRLLQYAEKLSVLGWFSSGQNDLQHLRVLEDVEDVENAVERGGLGPCGIIAKLAGKVASIR
jgi:hypothetical protein